jgi:hypothetical protein
LGIAALDDVGAAAGAGAQYSSHRNNQNQMNRISHFFSPNTN